MPRTTLHVTGFVRGTDAAELAPFFEEYGRLVRLDIPPPRTEDGYPYAFVEYVAEEDAEKALVEMEGSVNPFSMERGLLVQMARTEPYPRRTGRGPRGPRRDFDRRDRRNDGEREYGRGNRDRDDRGNRDRDDRGPRAYGGQRGGFNRDRESPRDGPREAPRDRYEREEYRERELRDENPRYSRSPANSPHRGGSRSRSPVRD